MFGGNSHADVRPAEIEFSAKELKYKETDVFALLSVNHL